MSAAWEWRSFSPAGTTGALQELAALAAGRLGLPAPEQVTPERDTYLVMSGLRHNLKLRRGSLETKQLVRRLRHGYSLWQDKEVWNFPLGPAEIRAVGALLPSRRWEPPDTIASPDALVSVLKQSPGSLSVVHIDKQRVRLDNGLARLEIAALELPGAARWFSFCVDGYHLEAVREIVRRCHLRKGARPMSYIEFLHEALWWFPATAKEVVSIDVRETG